MSTGFQLTAADGMELRFRYYQNEAPATAAAFTAILPFDTTLFHAKVSGEEIWTPDGPRLHIAQENNSVYIQPGEVVIGPIHKRNKVSGCMGIMYGEGHLKDSGNIFAHVWEEDLEKLKVFGWAIWRGGQQAVRFEAID